MSNSIQPAEPCRGKPRERAAEQLTAENVRTIAELERATQSQQSTSDRIADRISAFCGSLVFIWVHLAAFTLWILANTVFCAKPFDPYPFNFLTLTVSLEAIFLSAFILISENREGRVNARRSHLDLQINLLAEQENTRMLILLKEIAAKVGVPAHHDDKVSALAQPTEPEKLLRQIDRSMANPGAGG